MDDPTLIEHEAHSARIVNAEAALRALDELESAEWTRQETVDRMRAMYTFRERRFKTLRGDVDDGDGIVAQSLAFQRLVYEVIDAQRASLVQMRNEGVISAEVMRTLERELDLEQSRLEL